MGHKVAENFVSFHGDIDSLRKGDQSKFTREKLAAEFVLRRPRTFSTTLIQKKRLQGPSNTIMSRKQTPSEFLNQIRGRPVMVKLNSGVDYRGVLSCLDGYMNIALEQTEEYVNGQLKNKYGDAFIRGNNVLYISTQKRR